MSSQAPVDSQFTHHLPLRLRALPRPRLLPRGVLLPLDKPRLPALRVEGVPGALPPAPAAAVTGVGAAREMAGARDWLKSAPSIDVYLLPGCATTGPSFQIKSKPPMLVSSPANLPSMSTTSNVSCSNLNLRS